MYLQRADRRSRPVVVLVCIACAVTAFGACAPEKERAIPECPDPEKLIELTDIHYPELTCESATELAEGRLTSGIYRTSCRQLAPAAGLPNSVLSATILDCAPASDREGYEGGVVANIQLCCH